MKILTATVFATALSVFSLSALAAQPAQVAPHKTTVVQRASDIEAGSNIAPGAQSTGRSMDDAFNVHTLVAGEWY